MAETCMSIKVPRSTIYNWLKEDAEFKEAKETLDLSFVEFVEGLVKKRMVDDKSDSWMEKYLRSHSDKWNPPAEMEHSGAVRIEIINSPVKTEVSK